MTAGLGASSVVYFREKIYFKNIAGRVRFDEADWSVVFSEGVDYWLWWILACILLAAAWILVKKAEVKAGQDRTAGPQRRKNVFSLSLLIIILLISFILRVYKAEEHPYCFGDDGAWNCAFSCDLLHGRRTFNVFTFEDHSKETLFMYLMMPFLAVFGNNITAVALFLAVIGTMTCAAAYFFGSKEFDKKYYGLAGAAFLAAAPGFLMDGRIPYRRIICPLCLLLLLYYLSRSIRREKWSDFIGSGAIMGFGLLTYHAFRLIPAAAILTLIVSVFLDPKFIRRNKWKFSASLAACIIIYSPMLYYLFHWWGPYMGRASGELKNFFAKGDFLLNLKAFVFHFTPFFDQKMHGLYYPMASFPLFYLGLIGAVFRIRKKMNLFCLISFVLLATTYIGDTWLYPPNPSRSNTILALYVFFALTGFSILDPLLRKVKKFLPAALLLFVCTADIVLGAQTFFNRKDNCLIQERESALLARRLNTEGYQVRILDWRWSPVVKFLAYHVPDLYEFQGPNYYRQGIERVEGETIKRLKEFLRNEDSVNLVDYKILIVHWRYPSDKKYAEILERFEEVISKLRPDVHWETVYSEYAPKQELLTAASFPAISPEKSDNIH